MLFSRCAVSVAILLFEVVHKGQWSMTRKCFYSFHYKPDCSRASQVRNIGVIEGNQPVSDHDWEEVTKVGTTP